MFLQPLFSSRSDHWSTPSQIYLSLNDEFNFTFDPCPLFSSDSGLNISWNGRVFCNPPYSKISQFLKKGLFHLSTSDVELLVYLVPARTDTAWFHDFVYQKSEIRFIRGRLKFGFSKNNAPFPSMVVIYRSFHLGVLPCFS